jgi:hypothetical protein
MPNSEGPTELERIKQMQRQVFDAFMLLDRNIID